MSMNGNELEKTLFSGLKDLETLTKRSQMMANIVGECVFITGHAQKITNLKLIPSSFFLPDPNNSVSIFWMCWPERWRYRGRWYVPEE